MPAWLLAGLLCAATPAPPPRPAPGLAARLRAAPELRHRAWVEGLAAARLEAAGIVVRGRVDPFWLVDLDAAEADALLALGAQLHAPPRLRPALDVARVDVGADATDGGDGFAAPLRGAGVLIGSYDLGLALHPDFADRLRATWSQSSSAGAPPAGHGYGTACTAPITDAAGCGLEDPSGHGTAVLSVAAGADDRYRGVAPEAQLAVATSTALGQLLEGIAWLESVADSAALPLVLNLSIVTQEGPHDGRSAVARALSALPFPVVVAAGNDGLEPLHAAGDLADTIRLAPTFAASSGERGAVVDLWADAGGRLEARALTVDDAGAVLGASSWVDASSPGRTERWDAVRVELDGERADSGRPHVRVELRFTGSATWIVEVRGEGGLHAWLEPVAEETTLPGFGVGPAGWEVTPGDAAYTLSDLATAPGVLAVSAYVTRPDGLGVAGGRLDPIGSFGPSLDPAFSGPKPDLAAPGALIVAASPWAPGHAAGRGSSLAAPFVSGAAALLLASRPEASPAEIRAWILDTARAPPDDDPRWGAGKLDVSEAVAQVEPRADCSCRSAAEGPRSPIAGLWGLLVAAATYARARRRVRRAARGLTRAVECSPERCAIPTKGSRLLSSIPTEYERQHSTALDGGARYPPGAVDCYR